MPVKPKSLTIGDQNNSPVVATAKATNVSTTIPVEIDGNVNDDTKVQPDPSTVGMAAGHVEQGAKYEAELLKHLISSAAIMAAQGREFSKAKNVLRNSGADEEVVQAVIDDLYQKSGLAPSTMNRRIQIWELAVNREIIDPELQLKIEKSPSLTPELLKEMEARIGSITGTQFMRQLGILPQLEDKRKKKAKTAKEKIEAKATQMKALVKEMQDLIQSDEVREQVPDKNILKDYYKLIQDVDETIARFKKIDWLIQTPNLATPPLGLPTDLSIPSFLKP